MAGRLPAYLSTPNNSLGGGSRKDHALWAWGRSATSGTDAPPLLFGLWPSSKATRFARGRLLTKTKTAVVPVSRWRSVAATVALTAVCIGCAGTSRYGRAPGENGSFRQTGMASYYGAELHGHTTASGERYDMHALTAAHPSLPFDTRVRVTNLSNNRSVIVRINDRGPHTKRRIIDLSYAAAKQIGMTAQGTAEVRIEVIKGEE
jgi:rare lipoprotein A